MTEQQRHALHKVYTLAKPALNIEGGEEDAKALGLLSLYADGTLVVEGPSFIAALPHLLRLANYAAEMWTATPEESRAITEVSALAAHLAKGAA